MEGRENSLQELNVKLNALLNRYQEMNEKVSKLEQENSLLIEQNTLLKQTLANVKEAKAVALSGNDIQETRRQISHLIREIDKCIALISV